MTYQAAGYAGVAVVACKTEKGIIRAIKHPFYRSSWRDGAKLVEAIIFHVGSLNLADTEWTGFYYRSLPYYLPAALVRPNVESGVWLYPWKIPPTTERYGCELGISDHEHPIKLGEIPR